MNKDTDKHYTNIRDALNTIEESTDKLSDIIDDFDNFKTSVRRFLQLGEAQGVYFVVNVDIATEGREVLEEIEGVIYGD